MKYLSCFSFLFWLRIQVTMAVMSLWLEPYFILFYFFRSELGKVEQTGVGEL